MPSRLLADPGCTGGDNGSLWWWDWMSGHCFQQNDSLVQSGSLEAEAGIYACAFDKSGAQCSGGARLLGGGPGVARCRGVGVWVV